MITYIKFDVLKHYVELNEELNEKLYNIGETWADYLSNKWIKLSDEQAQFKVNNPKASVKEVFEMKLEEVIIPEKTTDDYKKEKIEEVRHYDESDDVNVFYIQGLEVWLDKQTRTGLKLRFEAEIAAGKEETSLWYNNMQFPLTLENAMQMLYAIENYASACYDNTQKHIAEIEKLEIKEDIENYDFTVGYPEKLNF